MLGAIVPLLVFGAACVGYWIWFTLSVRRAYARLRAHGAEVLGPRPRAFAGGNRLDLLRRGPLEALAGYARALPPDARHFVVWCGTRPHVVVLDPELLMQVFTNKDGAYVRNVSITRDLFRHALIGSVGERWKKRREILSPGFRQEMAGAAVPLIACYADQLVDEWKRRGAPFKPARDLSALMLRVLGGVVYGFDFDVERHGGAALHRAQAIASARAILRLFFPAAAARLYKPRRFRQARRHFDMIVDEVLRAAEATRAAGGQPSTVMRSLLDALAAGELSRDEVREEIFGLLIAGHETSATALTWIVALMAKHKEIQERCRREIEAIGDRPLDAAALDRLPALQQVVHEALRMFPPVPIAIRTTTRETRLGELELPEGTEVHAYSLLTHRDPRLWEAPARFDPSRFQDGAAARTSRCHYYPFLVGPHTCIAKQLATVELVTAMARLLAHARIELHGELREDFRVSLHPSGFTISLERVA
jgi:cytochrome P450